MRDLELAERLRAHVLTFGDDVKVELGERYAVFKRGGLEFAIAGRTHITAWSSVFTTPESRSTIAFVRQSASVRGASHTAYHYRRRR